MHADEIIDVLGLQPHPEGGWFAETWRDDTPPRGAGTAIYFLLRAGERSHWHRIDAAETWHHYTGAPLELSIAHAGAVTTTVLGTDLTAGQRPQATVPAGAWQAAATTGELTLVGCTVAPAFRYEGFELAPPGWEPA
jgi:predicted cupin superfamily sugar epimerase